jgi:hypothetical protein
MGEVCSSEIRLHVFYTIRPQHESEISRCLNKLKIADKKTNTLV